MPRNLSTIILTITAITLLFGCSSEPSVEIVTEQNTTQDTISEQPESQVEEQSGENIIWSVYEGNVGLYGQQIVMELAIQGTKVSGSYFYAKHQKPLTLSGEMDPVTNEIFLSESYKGKTTGYMEFTLVKGELNGYWKKSLSAKEEEPFHADMVDLGTLSSAEYKPQFHRYENEHEVPFYDAEEEYSEEVTNVLTINKLGNGHLSFFYHVICTNGHMGTLEGMAKMVNEHTAMYTDGDKCEVLFHFKKDGKKEYIEVEVTGDCTEYHGFRAYFDWEMYKVK